MTVVNINLKNVGSGTSSIDSVTFYSPVYRDGTTTSELVSTAEENVPLVDGAATVDLIPGPVRVHFKVRGIADTVAKDGTVPDSGPVSLNAVLQDSLNYTPGLINGVLAEVEAALANALTEVEQAVDNELGEAVQTAVDAAESAESKVDSYTPRVVALEAMGGLSPESPVDGQTANLVSQPDTLTRAAITETTLGLVDYVSPSGMSQHAAFLQGKIDALESSGGGTLTLMPGTYNINTTLNIPNKVSFRGLDQQAVIIDASSVPADTPAIWVMPKSTGNNLEGFRLVAWSGRNAIGILYGRDSTMVSAVADFTATSIRVEGFKVGISASFSWCGVFRNVRVHSCTTALKFGSQVNAIEFNGWITNFFENGAELTNVEGITFNTASFESTVSTGHAIRLFQSQAVLVQPYFEHIPKLATVGSTGESQGATSSIVITNGRVCGTLTLSGANCQVTVTSPWVIHSSPGTPFAIDMGGEFNRQPRQIRVDDFSLPSDGVKVVKKWDARDGIWGIDNAYGGAGVTHVIDPSHAVVTSPVASQGIKIGNLEVGKQYVFSYRARKSDGGVALREGNNSTFSIKKVDAADSDFRVVHTPFVARETPLRMMWQGDLDLQWFSLTEGLNFLDRT